MSNVFQEISKQIKDTRIVIWVFVMSVAMMLIGLWHFYEDVLSSKYGLEMLDNVFGLRPVAVMDTYWTMSVAPQVAQVIFFYLYLTNTKKKWAMWAALGAFLIDFGADVWFRSDANLFSNPVTFFATIFMTFAFFTVGSELFITTGTSLVLELFPPFIVQFKRLIEDVIDAFTSGLGGQSKPPESPKPSEHKPDFSAKPGSPTPPGAKIPPPQFTPPVSNGGKRPVPPGFMKGKK